MSRLYASPLRVYVFLGALALIGIYSGFNLPISLFPNSTKPEVVGFVPYGSMTAEEFLNTYGTRLEKQLNSISSGNVEVEQIEATYGDGGVNLDIRFKWGVDPQAALKEVRNVVNAFASQLTQEVRNGIWTWLDNRHSGFFALALYSDKRSLDELYDLLEPILTSRLSSVKDADNPVLFNPMQQEVRIQLLTEVVSSLQLFPSDIETAVETALGGRNAGSVTVGPSQLQIQMPRQIREVTDMAKIAVPTPSGRVVHLGEIAHIELGPASQNSQIWKTGGSPSLILYAKPKPGGNIKRMSEEMLVVTTDALKGLPSDIHFRKIVDPSEFIRSAIDNVLHEVAIAALLAVVVLFLFIGSLRNVITAAIEIPMSMVLAFILMRLFGMNLNLISLGGLALSAGMNVDASVVVMENIFRHFEMHPGPHDFHSRLRILVEAVNEVRFAVIASTIASLVVFLPLTFTSDLSYAILGDLAKAVVFSHGFSAFVALLLVPTIRLQLMKGGEAEHHSPIERQLNWLENTYSRALDAYLRHPRFKWVTYGSLSVVLVLLATLVLPRLPKEVVGLPDTDMMVLGIGTEGNTLPKQMEAKTDEIERDLLNQFGDKIAYTFSMVEGANDANVFARLKDKSEMRTFWKALEAHFTNSPVMHFEVNPWNPSELPIPNPPDMRIAVRGGTLTQRRNTAREVGDLLEGNHVFSRTSFIPSADTQHQVVLQPHIEQWEALRAQGARFGMADIADLIRVATNGRWIGFLPIKDRATDVILRYPTFTVNSVEDVSAFPIGVGSKLIPLRALSDVSIQEAPPEIFRRDQRELFSIEGRENQEDKSSAKKDLEKAKTLVADWNQHRAQKKGDALATSVTFENASKDLDEAIHQLAFAVGLSILLILLTLVVQFGSIAESLLVLISVPLGFIGVLLSLWVFRSTLSLNSILGVILLNGIAVNNSIILVDFIKRLADSGRAPREAAIEAAKKRLRPILITSLTTVLGMLPIALGTGQGGRILQPLGIAVSGGLWVSMGLTLFLVPAMQVSYLEWRSSHQGMLSQWLTRNPFRLGYEILVRSFRRPTEATP